MTEYRHRPLQPARDYLFLLSPTVGTFNSTINLNGINAPTIGNIRDISGGFGLFGLFTTPHADFSNLFFRTDIDGSYGLDLPKITGNPFAPIVPITESFDTVGNLFYVNTYLNKDDCVTPNIGFGYFYHRIKGQYTTVTVTEPIAKLGLRFNLKGLRLVWNPYISYAWDRTDVAIRNGAMAVDTKASNDSLIYGTNLRWRWRMIQSELRYSYKDSLVGKKNAHAFGLQTSVFFNAWSGISANFNYRNGETAHGGYDPVYANQDLDRVLPVDVIKEMLKNGEIGSLHDYYYSTVGNGTSVANAKIFGNAIAKDLLADNVNAVILTST